MNTESVPSIEAVVRGLDEAGIVKVLGARPDLAVPPPSDLRELAARATGPTSFLACFDRLDRGCRQTIEALCLLPRPTTVAAVVELLGFGVDRTVLDAILGELTAQLCLVRTGDRLDLNPGADVVGYPAGLGPTLTAVLGRHTSRELAEIAQRLGVPPGPTKAIVLAALVAALSDSHQVVGLVRTGPKGTDVLAHHLSMVHPVASSQGGLYAASDRTPAGWMLRRGMLGTLTWDAAVMPREVGLALRGGRPFAQSHLTPPAIATSGHDQNGIDQQGTEAALRLVDDLQALLDEWGSNPPPLLRDGGLGIREIRRAAKFLDRPERDAAMILELAGIVGLAGVSWEEGLVLPSPSYDRWVETTTSQRWAWVADGWRLSGFDLSVAGAPTVREKAIPALLNRSTDPGAAARRDHYLSVLGDVEVAQVAEPGSIFRQIEWERPGVWGSGLVGAQLLFDWIDHEADVIGVVASGGITSAGRLIAAGLSSEAADALASRMGDEVAKVLFQGDLTAIAPGRLVPAVRAEMELIANVESSGAATVYRLSEVTVRRAFDAGRSADEIAAFLRDHASRGVPQTLEYLVADLGRRHGRIRVGQARSVIRCEDASLVAEILGGRRTGRLGLRSVAPTVLVSGQKPDVVVDTLRNAGYLPAQESATGELVVTGRDQRRSSRALHAPAARTSANPPPSRGLSGAAEPGSGFKSLENIASYLVREPSPPAKNGKRKSTQRDYLRTAVEMMMVPAPVTLWEAVPTRPAAIIRDRKPLLELFAEGRAQEWVIRVAYTNSKGRDMRVNGTPLEVDDDCVVLECLPQLDLRSVAMDRIVWARVMTDAEEGQLL